MSLTLHAHAKVNLTLEVLGKRDDGYHEIRSIMQTISLADTLTFAPCDSIEFSCDVNELASQDNLVIKACNLLKEESGFASGASIQLSKRIPSTAGLGSGSTDAAATLSGLNRLWNLHWPVSKLSQLAAALGSDVPFFLYGGTALVSGRGEHVEPLRPTPRLCMVLLTPALESVARKTAIMYSRITPSHFTSGQITDRLVQNLGHSEAPDISLFYNAFEQVAFDFFSGLHSSSTILLEAGATNVHIAGAGPMLFTIVPDESRGHDILNKLEAEGCKAYLVHSAEAIPAASVSDTEW